MNTLQSTPSAFVKAVQECREREEKRMGRAYASGHEAWAVLKHLLERAKADEKTMDSLQGDIWAAVKADNMEEVMVELNAMSNKAMEVCMTYATIAAEVNRAAEDLAEQI